MKLKLLAVAALCVPAIASAQVASTTTTTTNSSSSETKPAVVVHHHHYHHRHHHSMSSMHTKTMKSSDGSMSTETTKTDAMSTPK